MTVGPPWCNECPYDRRPELALSCRREQTEKTAICKSGRGFSPGTKSFDPVNLIFPAARTVRNKCLLFKLSAHGILLKQPGLTKTMSKRGTVESYGNSVYPFEKLDIFFQRGQTILHSHQQSVGEIYFFWILINSSYHLFFFKLYPSYWVCSTSSLWFWFAFP